KFGWVGCRVLEVFIPALAACAKESNNVLALRFERFFRNDHRIIEDGEAEVIKQEGYGLFTGLLDGEGNIGRKIKRRVDFTLDERRWVIRVRDDVDLGRIDPRNLQHGFDRD